MAKDIDKIIEFLKAECERKENAKRSGIRYSPNFKTGVNDLYKSGLTDKQILKLLPISIYSIQNWTGRNKDKRFKKVKVVNKTSTKDPKRKNSYEKIENLLTQIKTILLAELILIILLIIYL